MQTHAFPKLSGVIEYLEGLSARADLAVLERLLKDADVSREDLKAVCHFCDSCYQRNTIARSDWFELVALCWKSGQVTPIHDHHGSSCAFRVVEGTGTEVRFCRTPSGLICPDQTTPMNPGYVCAAEDEDIHLIANMQPPGTDLITLHCYSPALTVVNTYSIASASVVPHDCRVNTDAVAD